MITDIKREVIFRTSRSSGPGGQNVNKVETKVTLLWEIASSTLFTEVEKDLIRQKLKNRINIDGILSIDISESRSQLANKDLALQRLVHLLDGALKSDKKRIPTKIPRAKILARLDRKKQQSKKKSDRRWKMD